MSKNFCNNPQIIVNGFIHAGIPGAIDGNRQEDPMDDDVDETETDSDEIECDSDEIESDSDEVECDCEEIDFDDMQLEHDFEETYIITDSDD